MTLTLLQPMGQLIANWTEVSLTATDLFEELLPALAIAFVCLTAGAALLCATLPERAVALFAALALGLWLQGFVLVWSYGAFDGGGIDWESMNGWGVLELTIWSALLGSALIRPAAYETRALPVAGMVLILELASLGALLAEQEPLLGRSAAVQAPDSESHPSGSLDAFRPERFSIFSEHSNVFVIVLDTYQSDFFAELLRDPEFASSVPPGFVFYRNAVAHYPSTRISLQSILTASFLDPLRESSAWRNAQMQKSLPTQLAQRGWSASLLSIMPQYLSCYFVHYGYSCFGPATYLQRTGGGAAKGLRSAQHRRDADALLRLGLFRSAPHFLKSRIYDGADWKLPALLSVGQKRGELDSRIDEATRLDLQVLRALTRRIAVQDVAPSFRFLHLQGAHYPYSVHADCSYRLVDNSALRRSAGPDSGERAIALATARCISDRVFALLRGLDQAGGYDNSLIFIVADHGHPRVPVDRSMATPPLPTPPPSASGPPTDDPLLGQSGSGVPLFLVKRMGERAPLRISDEPVSLCDVPASVFAELDFAADFGCESIFEAGADRKTPRPHYRQADNANRGSPPYGFRIYNVEGHSWQRASWAGPRE